RRPAPPWLGSISGRRRSPGQHLPRAQSPDVLTNVAVRGLSVPAQGPEDGSTGEGGRMTTEESGSLARGEDLDEAEGAELLGTRQVGRVAYNDPDGPVVMPVNYVLQDGMVLFRVAPYSRLADRLRDNAASFQVDHVDEEARTGWSVLVRGHAAHPSAWEL